MEFNHSSSRFCYSQNPNRMNVAEDIFGLLEIYVHHARNIHNICIYDKQDVYAKFSLTYNPDETLSTRIVNGGGRNPDFNQNLFIKVKQLDSVLKCEIWMLSRARNYMGDQLLGFALVPISQVLGKGKGITQDYSLSSTDLFHSPAGTVRLTLSLSSSLPENPSTSSSISSEVVLYDRKVSEVDLDPVEYSRIEFPDINVVRENQQMVSEYFDGKPAGSFLHLGSSPELPVEDDEMTLNFSEENQATLSVSPNESSVQNSGFISSTMTTISDDRNSGESVEKKSRLAGTQSSNSIEVSITMEENHGLSACPDTPTSKDGTEVAGAGKNRCFSSKNNQKSKTEEENMICAKFGEVFSTPLANIKLETEQSAMQQQIVDLYMRSMQQFTESLAKMKLPMDVDKAEGEEDDGVKSHRNNGKVEVEKKKDGGRVFYGSRAFF